MSGRALQVAAAALVAGLALTVAAITAVAGVATGAAGRGTAAGLGADAGTVQTGIGVTGAASAAASAGIPPRYLLLFIRAAARYGLDWSILAGIGKVECDDGRDPDPSCTREGAENSAGAGGPMQFLASTWARYGVDADGDGRADRWDPADAIYAAAAYLRAAGAPGDYQRAIFAYNHASWYVAEVERWAAVYRADAGAAAGVRAGEGAGEFTARGADAESGPVSGSPTPVRYVPGARAVLAPGDGHLALLPTDVSATVQAMVIAGNELQELPYGAAGHPDPRGAASEDCSSSINYILYRAGVRPIAEILAENPLAQDYIHWGLPGPGRWVTISATSSPTAHVFIVIAGLRLDTSRDGTDIGPNRAQDGPRWRILDHIPTWAHWSVRHPPGL